MRTVFLRALAAEDKATALLAAIHKPVPAQGRQRFEVDTPSFALVPRSPFAYWVSEAVRNIFVANEPLEASGRDACSGATTNDDQRFLRLWYEVSSGLIAQERIETYQRRWCVLAKGGEYSRYFADPHLVVDWASDGLAMKSHITDYRGKRGWGYQWSAALNGYTNYFRPGLTWSRRSQRGLSLRVMAAGGLFGDKGPAVFVSDDNVSELLFLLAATNSRPFRDLVAMQMAFGSYEVGVIERTPLPRDIPSARSRLATLAGRAWSLKRRLDTHNETSHAFTLPALLQVDGDTLAGRANAWRRSVRSIEGELVTIQAEIDERCFDLYGIDDPDRQAMMEGFAGGEFAAEAGETDGDTDDEGDPASNVETVSLAAELVSWAVGIALGRFDVRLATGARELPIEPEPFDPLPICSPAMLTGEDGLPLSTPPAGYSIAFPEDGIRVDDPGHSRDLTAAVRSVFEEVFGQRADAVWQEASALLDPKNHELRSWLSSGLFEHHLKHHSKSRRKAPILWQLGLPSGRTSIWLYSQRLSRESVFQLQNDVLAPKLIHEERHLADLVAHSGGSPSAKERKEIAEQEVFVEELRALLDEVKSVAPLWSPNLDDGVVLTMAPLWRLVPQHKPWQKELKSKWDELVAGVFDWSHLAMHLWPERVVPKCANDRSLAIAHGLEDALWVENPDGKWQLRTTPAKPIEELIRERTSHAVKAALTNVLYAPGMANGPRRAKANAFSGKRT